MLVIPLSTFTPILYEKAYYMSTPMTKTKPNPIDDVSRLIANVRQDPLAFARLYDLYSTSIYRYLYSRVGNQADAEDLTGQTFLTALEKINRYRERGRFKACYSPLPETRHWITSVKNGQRWFWMLPKYTQGKTICSRI